ncbi:Bidirectional sugar transporter SWEET [Quillaja saponaria]|uniref:Bidirectional sugar transporter SWEET n=1 Tax=Quillaja saponaria TaxID=32244 RepID=A0AAD7Q133_QUISA|nr:Bidirectional sugar transporter SWEET [Quillaja saponaria]
MAAVTSHDHDQLSFVFGLLGNLVSFLVFLAPMITFFKIIKKRSTEGFHSVPYSVALFSCMLILYYAYLKGSGNALMLITINSFGSVIEIIYLSLFLIFAPGRARKRTVQLLLVFNMGAFGLILLITSFIPLDHQKRVEVVGWICAVFSVCVFASPLSVMRKVIKTKSVKYMPLPLSLCLTLTAAMWFCYGLFKKDFYIATPNIAGFALSCAQMALYFYYRKGQKKEEQPVVKKNKEIEIPDDAILIDGTVITIRTDEITNHRSSVETHKNQPAGNIETEGATACGTAHHHNVNDTSGC